MLAGELGVGCEQRRSRQAGETPETFLLAPLRLELINAAISTTVNQIAGDRLRTMKETVDRNLIDTSARGRENGHGVFSPF
jgi:hypothetical protein